MFIALARMVTFCKEGGGMLSVWALRARFYKTKAERLLSPQKLFDLFLPKSESVLSVLEQKLPEEREGLFLFIALRWMQDPGRMMVWLAENIQACLRIFCQIQHQWLARDILHQAQGVYYGFCLMTHRTHPFYPFNPW